MKPTIRPRRSALYLPASNPRAIDKARTLPADVIILDLEDAVAPDAKIAARAAAVEAVRAGGFGHREVAIRANALDTPWGHDDLAAIAASGANAVLVPKVSSPADVDACNAVLATAPDALQLWTMIETCGAVLRLDQIAARTADTRLSLWIMGTNDLAKEMRARATPERTAFLPFLAQAVAAARAHGLAVLDGVCNEFRDLAAFTAEAEQGRLYGFDGKSLIHPAQIDPANAVFGPSPAEIDDARAVIAAFALPENAAKGVLQLNGRMIELLHRDQARQLLDMAALIGNAESTGTIGE